MAGEGVMTEGVLNGREAYVQALRQGLSMAGAQGCRELCCLDSDFSAWPLSEPMVLDALTAWALPHRKLLIAAASFDVIAHRHPRFVAWRRTWDHVVQARRFDPDDLAPGGPVGVLLAPGLFSLRLLDAARWRAAVSLQSADAIPAREWFDAVWQRSTDSFSASTLGL